MKLKEITTIYEATISDLHQDAQETAMKLFGFSDGDAADTLDFALSNADWESLSDEVREKLYSKYEKSFRVGFTKDNNTDPEKFIRPILKKDLGV